jgi:hypothetical protein
VGTSDRDSSIRAAGIDNNNLVGETYGTQAAPKRSFFVFSNDDE